MRIRPILLQLHLWVALTTGLFLIILGVTGAMLVFEPAYERARHPELLRVTPGQARLPLDTLVDRARPQGTPVIVLVPKENDESVQIFVMNAKKKPALVYLNQYTGAVLGMRTVAEQQQGLMLKARAFHKNLLQGKIGGKIVGAVTILSIFMALSGLVLWWPRKTFRVKTDASLARFNFDLHNVVGIFSSAVLLLLSLTGVVIAYPQVSRFVQSFDAPRLKEPAYAAPPGNPTRLSIDSLVRLAQLAIPGTPAAISLPPPGSAVMNMGIRLPGEPARATRSRLWIDTYTGQVLRADNSRNPTPGHGGSNIRLAIAMLHTGVLYGWITGTLILLGSVGQVVLVITGVLIWAKRKFRFGKSLPV
jgi:uncharacterized iron-regulated membrane protein